MKIEYDRDVDALYIQFQPTDKVAKSFKIQEGIIADLAPDGQIFGIEILDASKRMPLSSIGHIDLTFPITKAS